MDGEVLKMHKIIINGGKKLNGEINISGAKNSAVALIPASILCDEEVVITNVPNISDVDALEEILLYLNAKIVRANDNQVMISSENVINKPIDDVMAKRLRASYYFMGALLGKYKHVEMSFPGGCSIGKRPIDLHLKGFKALGARVLGDDENIILDADELKGTTIDLDFASVGATINIMFAAVKAKGTTIIKNAAKEPEIINVADFLNEMGANIKGAGTATIIIEGVNKLHSCEHYVIPDRIEAGTYIIIAAACGKKVTIKNIIPEHINSLLKKLKEMNIKMEVKENEITVFESNEIKPVYIKTEVYPGFPTDLQQVLASLLIKSYGKSIIEETIWENRFLNLYEIEKMGAKITVNDKVATIEGPTILKASEVNATDLRAGAGLVVAALETDGITTINNADYILRGYENIVEKLNNLGADVKLQ